MSDVTTTVDTYLSAWNEPDPDRRAALVEQVWAPDGTLTDPPMAAAGHAGISEMHAALQAQFPGHRFRRASAVDVHHDRFRVGWELVGPDGTVALAGYGRRAAGRRRPAAEHHRVLRRPAGRMSPARPAAPTSAAGRAPTPADGWCRQGSRGGIASVGWAACGLRTGRRSARCCGSGGSAAGSASSTSRIAADVSARHVSFLETGRSKPSREMVLRLAERLDVPLRDRNPLLLAAGFAPSYPRARPGRPGDGAGAGRDRPRSWPATSRTRRWWSTVSWNLVAANAGLALLTAGAAPRSCWSRRSTCCGSPAPRRRSRRASPTCPQWRGHLLDRLARGARQRRPGAGRAAPGAGRLPGGEAPPTHEHAVLVPLRIAVPAARSSPSSARSPRSGPRWT